MKNDFNVTVINRVHHSMNLYVLEVGKATLLISHLN